MTRRHPLLSHSIWRIVRWTALIRDFLSKVSKERVVKSKENQLKTLRAVLVCIRNVMSHSTGGWEFGVTRQGSWFPSLCQRSVLPSMACLVLFHSSYTGYTRLNQLYQLPTYPNGLILLKVFFPIQNIPSDHGSPPPFPPRSFLSHTTPASCSLSLENRQRLKK